MALRLSLVGLLLLTFAALVLVQRPIPDQWFTFQADGRTYSVEVYRVDTPPPQKGWVVNWDELTQALELKKSINSQH